MHDDLTDATAALLYAVGEGIRSLALPQTSPVTAEGLLGRIETAMKNGAGEVDLSYRSRLMAGIQFQQLKAYVLFGEPFQIP